HAQGNLLARWDIDTGDIEAAFAGADLVVEETYQTQHVDHAYLEPEAGTGWLDDEGVLNLRVSTQVVEHYRDVATILGIPEALVRLCSSVHACGPYRVENVRLRARCAYTNNPPTSAFRGFGGMQVVLGYESQIDEVARRLGLPPDEVRKRNALVKGDVLPVGQ